ncbi:N-glycosyltransferase [Aliiruegeria lutimaris]|uniref:N-glycosyltransferase n=2 Tax=Aliiruegeria lutimaris TaxID=571298 RepID=A0A1G9NQX6_9RHOB|nr:N-glycosyltransferase [Aliiruegeria lutimaris]
MPMVPFAKGLQARGHEVRVAALPDLGDDIAKHGFGHLVLKGPSDKEREEVNKRAMSVPREKVGKFFMSEFFMGVLARNFLPGLLDELNIWRPDLILRESTEFSGLIAAEKLGIRHARFEIVNGESEESIATNYTKEMDALRSFVSLEPIGGGYLRNERAFSAHPKVLDDTPRINSQEPFRFRTFVPATAPTTAPPEWLPPGDKPLVYMTFGTLAADEEHSRHVYAASIEAIAGLPVSVLLTTGKNAPHDLVQSVPDNVTVRQFVPQAEIFEHAKLMVCHGGSGTVLGGLASGVPMIVVPLFADQPDNARCLASAGLCIAVSDDDVPSLRAAITDALENPEMRRRAGQAASDFAALPTVEDALDILVGG